MQTVGIWENISLPLIMGYWSSVRSRFLARFFHREEVEVHKLAKKEWGQYSVILTEQNWSIKYLLYGFLAGYSESPEHLACSCSQSQRAIWVILPAHRACHIITATYKVPSPIYRPIFHQRIHPVIRSPPPSTAKKIYKPSSSFPCSDSFYYNVLKLSYQ